MSVEWSIDLTENRIPAVIAAIESGADECTGKIADGIAHKAQAQAPVLHGHLKAGIQVSAGGGANGHIVTAESEAGGADREYAHYQEYGTRKMAAQPFMGPAYQQAQSSDVPVALAEYKALIEGTP